MYNFVSRLMPSFDQLTSLSHLVPWRTNGQKRSLICKKVQILGHPYWQSVNYCKEYTDFSYCECQVGYCVNTNQTQCTKMQGINFRGVAPGSPLADSRLLILGE